ncbi:MAG TPA: metal-dependent hydrolase [Acidimicrobiales bacterium]
MPVRRISIGFAARSESRLFMDGDIIMSHVIAVLSSSFPEGEDFFVPSVRHHATASTIRR